MKELEKYRPRGNSIFETMSRGFLRGTLLTGLSLYVLGSVCLIFAYKKFTDPFKYGVVDVMNNVSFFLEKNYIIILNPLG